MKVFFILLFFSSLVVSCKSQQVLPLNSSWGDSPTGSYFKDLNNELDVFVGTWTANYSDKTITLIVSKESHQPFSILGKSFFKDELLVRYQIVNTGGLTIHSTLSNNFAINKDFAIGSVASRQTTNEITLIYNGGNCSIGLGVVYFKKITTNQFQWNYKPQTATLNDINCPPPVDSNIYLPTTENVVFTKQ